MAMFDIASSSPLTRFDYDFVQSLVSRMISGIRAPGGLDRAAHAVHDRAIVTLLEDLDPRTPVEAAIASMFVSAHYGAMANARAAARFPEGSRECARVTSLGASLGRLALQAARTLWQRQGVAGPRRRKIDPQPGGAAPDARDAPERQHPMSSGGAQPAGAGEDARGRQDPMPSEPGPEHDPDDDRVNLSWRVSAADEPADTGQTANERQHPMSSGAPQRPKPEYTRSGKIIPHGALYRPDDTPWNEPPACWQGPSWLAHRFPLERAERLSLWGPKSWDELTPEMRRLAWGYVHEPGVLEAHEARMAAEAAAAAAANT